MKTKHTPGNWKIYGTPDISENIFIIQADFPHNQVAQVPSIFSYKEDEREANAKLIAAAPEMLAALELIASTSNDHAIIRTAIKAIKKATE